MARKSRSTSKTSTSNPSGSTESPEVVVEHVSLPSSRSAVTLRDWFIYDLQGPIWVISCMIIAGLIGFAAGTGYWDILPRDGGDGVTSWRQNLANGVRSTVAFQLLTFHGKHWDDWVERFSQWAIQVEKDIEAEEYAQNPSHPRVFAVLREAVIRERGGYVHPDLGFLVPAPSGAARGLGMVRDAYHHCQVTCIPGVADEKQSYLEKRRELEKPNSSTNKTTMSLPPISDLPIYHQEEVLLKIPLAIQMTRTVATDTIQPLLPAEVKASLHQLDDAALLVLLLAHERGVGRFSRFLPYIASLPPEPSCGYSRNLRPYMLDAIYAYRDEIGVDVQGWPQELLKATEYAEKIVHDLGSDYGSYISTPNGISSSQNIEWALCQVASRATAGSEKHGSLRLVPLIDLINHDANAGGFIELTGKERLKDGDFVEATEEESGTFVVRSRRHGRRRPLRLGQELLANYNVPHYSPLDWFVSLGFVPPERWGAWEKIGPVLPKVRSDGPFAEAAIPTADIWKEKGPVVLEQLRSAEL